MNFATIDIYKPFSSITSHVLQWDHPHESRPRRRKEKVVWEMLFFFFTHIFLSDFSSVQSYERDNT